MSKILTRHVKGGGSEGVVNNLVNQKKTYQYTPPPPHTCHPLIIMTRHILSQTLERPYEIINLHKKPAGWYEFRLDDDTWSLVLGVGVWQTSLGEPTFYSECSLSQYVQADEFWLHCCNRERQRERQSNTQIHTHQCDKDDAKLVHRIGERERVHTHARTHTVCVLLTVSLSLPACLSISLSLSLSARFDELLWLHHCINKFM